MPIYEYKCTECGQHLDIEQSITEESLTAAPGCDEATDGQHRLKKVFGTVGISFKGDGFYRNDSRRSPQKTSTSSGGGSESSSTSSDSSAETSKAGASKDSGSNGSDAGSKTTSSSSSTSSGAD